MFLDLKGSLEGGEMFLFIFVISIGYYFEFTIGFSIVYLVFFWEVSLILVLGFRFWGKGGCLFRKLVYNYFLN